MQYLQGTSKHDFCAMLCSHTITSFGQLSCFDLGWVAIEEELLQSMFEGEMLALRVTLRMTCGEDSPNQVEAETLGSDNKGRKKK